LLAATLASGWIGNVFALPGGKQEGAASGYAAGVSGIL